MNSESNLSPIHPPKLFLAPMEGVVDSIVRDILTSFGGIDQCVTEFLRVTQHLHSDAVFFRNCPELKNKSQTRSGTTVFLQLLGGQAEPLALNAKRAYELGAAGIDLNFGCPAPTVNRHDGGASLLKSPDRIHLIIKEVRSAVPRPIPVTAKIRLGYDDPNQAIENALAAQEGGAEWLTVHCRTKVDGYKPPAHWKWIPKIREHVKIPLIANGEIWTVSDYIQCKKDTGADQFMIGRGAIANPFLFKQIKDKELSQDSYTSLDIRNMLIDFFQTSSRDVSPAFAVARTKQWLGAIRLRNKRFHLLFENLKIIKNPVEFQEVLENIKDDLPLTENQF